MQSQVGDEDMGPGDGVDRGLLLPCGVDTWIQLQPPETWYINDIVVIEQHIYYQSQYLVPNTQYLIPSTHTCGVAVR